MTSISPIIELDKWIQSLCKSSIEARKSSYSPYSQFKVGASLLCTDGTVVDGCNVENASYGLAICAERTAFVKAVSTQRQEFKAIAIAADNKQDFVGPCGACRQFMAEFNPDIPIFLVRLDGKVQVTSLANLLPDPFTPKRMKLNFNKEQIATNGLDVIIANGDQKASIRPIVL